MFFSVFARRIDIGVHWRNWCSKSGGSNVFSADAPEESSRKHVIEILQESSAKDAKRNGMDEVHSG